MTAGHESPATAVAQLDVLNHLLRRPPWQLRFPIALENAFARRQQPAQLLAARIAVGLGVPVYLLSSALEWLTDSALFHSTAPVRLLALGLLLLSGLALYRIPLAKLRVEWLTTTMVVAVSFIQLHVSLHSAPVYHPLPLLWMLLPLAYLCTLSRVSLRAVLPVCLLCFVVFLLGLWLSPFRHSPAAPHALLLFTSTLLLLLLTGYLNERAQRQRFLQARLLSLHRRGLHHPGALPDHILDEELGILDRASLDRRLRTHLAGSSSAPPQIAVVICAIDDYQTLSRLYNDQEARFCLQTVARTAQRLTTGGADFVARRGPAQLALVLAGGNAYDALQAGERLRRQIQALAIPHQGAANDIVTVSCGAADTASLREVSADALLAAADRALEQAQRLGGNRSESLRSG